MSLISDTDFLIHSLRLSYLRDAEDPYGARIITLDPSYRSNPYIIAASLADPERWPELAMPSSPQLSEDDGERPSGFPGARLKHTQTIMGGRTGGLGMRVHAKRASTSKRLSGTPRQVDVKNFVSDNAPVQESLSTSVPVQTSVAKSPLKTAEPSTSQPQVQIQEPTMIEEAPVAKVVQFIPKFKGAAEMEARRRVRMAARRGPGGASQPPPPPNLDFSSSDEEGGNPMADDSSSSGDFDDDVPGEVDSMDEGDEFDPEFPASRAGMNYDSAIEVSSVFSAGTTSSGPISASSPTSGPSRARLSPVSESERLSDGRRRRQTQDSLAGMSFEMVTPAPSARQETRKMERSRSRTRNPSHSFSSTSSAPTLDISFARKKVPPIKPLKSSLSAMLASSDASSNPFAELYASISGRGESASTNVQVYFPQARQPVGKAMDLNVRKDATVEEVIGFSLWMYWKEGWLPKLDEGLSGEDDPRWETKVSAVGWILRIAEDDGEVDDDFPPPDRLGRISKFNADAYAILEATPAQIQQNQLIESKIQRLPVRTTRKAERLAFPGPSLPTTGPSSAAFGSALGSVPLSTSLGPSSSHGPQIFLRIRVEDTADAVHISTTIPVSAGMYMQEALELVCRKRKLNDPKDYALLLADMSILIPLDRTVASLQGKRELILIKRSMLGGDVLKGTGKTTDPNASIFKRMSDTPEIQFSSMADYTAGYKKYTIYRKAPMLLARQERTLAIDGVYIHIMPSTNKAMKAVFDSGKTSSYHIKSIADVQQTGKTSIFKLLLSRGGSNKRYDFEAESPRLAGEIVQTIKGLKASLERSGTVNKSRRSRHVG
ncbi:stress-activated map kinase interacting protein 1-domain-containing protein [Collybia nuda]|uniref:Stress-activated map kinase interacting protein 1-domain-containing protein n=1 Tax=Collybia nuda TaxID=64659 RepID=A0A9P6CFN7_9AGAR|nr:stress-activated map kinase interacting protein 1-domain-containing protein [Collybia nuda]